ncbi:hypothetical protein [Vibrio neonatus]|uniref:hypothetical protein n=1 Tax=Vibrio neonatus TaxID=278860 RepID=UPI0021C2D310|nr:hypothetical protein [Vibrio neonatus]
MKILKKYPLLAGSLLLTTLILSGCGGGGSDSGPKTTELTLDIQNADKLHNVLVETLSLYSEVNSDYGQVLDSWNDGYVKGYFYTDTGSATWNYNDQAGILNIKYQNAKLTGTNVELNGNINDTAGDNYILTANLKAHYLSSGKTVQSNYQSSNSSDFTATLTSSTNGSYKVIATDFDQLYKGEAHAIIIGKDNRKWELKFYPKVLTVIEPDSNSYNVNMDTGTVTENTAFTGLGQGSMSSFINDTDVSTVARLVDNGFTAITSVVKTFNHEYYLSDGFCSDGGSYTNIGDSTFKVGYCNQNGISLKGMFKDGIGNEYLNLDLDIRNVNTGEDGHLTASTIELKTSTYDSHYNDVDEIKFVGQYSDTQSNNQYVVLKSSDIYFDDQSFGLDYPISGKILVSTGGKTWTADLHGSTFDLTSPNGTTTQHTLSLMD